MSMKNLASTIVKYTMGKGHMKKNSFSIVAKSFSERTQLLPP